eukprot:gene8139-5673_t
MLTHPWLPIWLSIEPIKGSDVYTVGALPLTFECGGKVRCDEQVLETQAVFLKIWWFISPSSFFLLLSLPGVYLSNPSSPVQSYSHPYSAPHLILLGLSFTPPFFFFFFHYNPRIMRAAQVWRRLHSGGAGRYRYTFQVVGAELRTPRRFVHAPTLPCPDAVNPSSASSSAVAVAVAEAEALPWETRMARLYGEGNYPFFRSLYKSLCEEMRREVYTKPPSAFETVIAPVHQRRLEQDGGTHDPAPGPDAAATTTSTDVADAATRSEEECKPAPGASPSSASAAAGTTSPSSSPFGPWSVHYNAPTNTLVFERRPLAPHRGSGAAVTPPPYRSGSFAAAAAAAHVVAYAKVELKDPERMNAQLTFVDWCPVEVFIRRDDVVLHFSMACNEGGMHMRNVRVYDATTSLEEPLKLWREAMRLRVERAPLSGDDSHVDAPGADEHRAKKEEEKAGDDSATSSSSSSTVPQCMWDMLCDPDGGPGMFESVRRLYYDGPCLWHLELDMQNELYDLLQDYGVDLNWMRWMHEWVFYYEHRITVQWMCGVLLRLVPPELQGGEEDFLTPEEREAMDEPFSDWIREPLS